MDKWARLVFFALTFTVTFPMSLRPLEDDSIELENDNGTRSFDSGDNCTCDWRYLRHYEAKGCTPVNHDACGCPTKYECPNVNEVEGYENECYYKGQRYPAGAMISTSNNCERCRCSRGPDVRVVCYSVECPQYASALEPNCHYVYEKNRCCPVRTACVQENETLSMESSSNTCEHNGRAYSLGAKIYMDDDPCEVCLCTEEWAATGTTSCYQIDCDLEKSRSKLLEGCVPVYQDNICCPIDFYCAPDDEFVTDTMSKEAPEDEEIIPSDSSCLFGGKFYNVGQSLTVNQETSCLLCSCRVPPDFTCIREVCEPNPSETFCYPSFTADGCCPKYECLLGDDIGNASVSSPRLEVRSNRELEDDGIATPQLDPESPCLETHCNEDRTCMLYLVRCDNTTCPPVPTCLRTNSSCPTPSCGKGCVVIQQDQFNCPTCVCGDDIEKNVSTLKCHMPHCSGQNCRLVSGDDGCPICSCDKPCEVLECPPGCNVESTLEGRCPKCVCEDETEGCPTPVCEHEGCRIENLPNGCPTCVCDRGNTSTHGRTLEMAESRPQHQTQEQTLDVPSGQHNVQSSPNDDDYDDILVMRRSPTQNKANIETRSLTDFLEVEMPVSSKWLILDTDNAESHVNSHVNAIGNDVERTKYNVGGENSESPIYIPKHFSETSKNDGDDGIREEP